jgi:thiamine biosynthesis lipoprotein
LISVCSVIAVCSVLSFSARTGEDTRYEDSRVAMACTYNIVAYGDSAQPVRQYIHEAFDEIDRIDRLMSHYKRDSALSQLNRTAAQQAVRVNDELFDFIAECVRYSRLSDGAFDITVGPLMRAWGFFRGEGRLPTAAELKQARANLGYRHIILDEKARTIRFAKPGLELDLGGIAKGYAVDRAVAVLKGRGIRAALVNACGSTIYGLGVDPATGQGWAMQLRDPLDERKTAQTVWLKNQALSVSGSYEKFFELKGKRYSHIMNPRTGLPVQGVLSVAVISNTGTAGDALDNVCYVKGVGWSRRSWNSLNARAVIFFLPKASGWQMQHLGAPAISPNQ